MPTPKPIATTKVPSKHNTTLNWRRSNSSWALSSWFSCSVLLYGSFRWYGCLANRISNFIGGDCGSDGPSTWISEWWLLCRCGSAEQSSRTPSAVFSCSPTVSSSSHDEAGEWRICCAISSSPLNVKEQIRELIVSQMYCYGLFYCGVWSKSTIIMRTTKTSSRRRALRSQRPLFQESYKYATYWSTLISSFSFLSQSLVDTLFLSSMYESVPFEA